jgi:DNA-binding response OmpR family regulator
MKQRILIVDDIKALAPRVKQLLEHRGLSVSIAGSLPEVFDQLSSRGPFDMIVLGSTGGGLPVQFVLDNLNTQNGKNAVMLQIDSNDVESEDKLWNEIEQSRKIVDRIDAMLGREPVSAPHPVRCGPLIINLENHEVRIRNQLLNLSLTEAQMLHYFARRVGELVRREDVLTAVWGDNKLVKEQIVDVYVKRLRTLCAAEADELSFRTVSKMGYQLLLRTTVRSSRK